MSSERSERTLVWVLRLLGASMLLAVGAIVMPTDWMSSTNDALGLEPFHRAPLTEYLTRSLSALYAYLGAIFLYVSRDVRRYRGLIAFSAKLMAVGGVFFTILDFWAGMPAHWSWTEGPPVVVVACWMVWLAGRVPE